MASFLKNLILLSLAFALSNKASAQQLWQSITADVNIEGEQKIHPIAYSVFKLDDEAFKNIQLSITEGYNTNATTIYLPTPTGELELYKIFEERILPKALNEKYPLIKTYTAINAAHSNIVAKLDYTLFGFHAMVSNGVNTYYIDPYSNINTGYYKTYYKSDNRKALTDRMICNQMDEAIIDGGIELSGSLPPLSGMPSAKVNGAMRKNYTLALACTGEYAVAVAGPTPTKASVLSAMVTSVNRVSGIYELEYAVHFNLIPNNDTLIFLDGTTDPYTNNSGGTMLGQNNATIDSIIGDANYDFGHVFSTGGGGIASLSSICNVNTKASGVTGLPNPVGDNFDVDYVAHEIGHQFGGSHTFDATSGSCGGGNRSQNNAYEVGSGTTIQAYAGICDYNNVQLHSDAYFSIRSMNQMGTFITTGGGAACADTINYGNTPPVLPYMADTFYIPYLTYFELSAKATDVNNDTLTYCWEQYNRNNQGINWDAPTRLNPIFRTFTPTTNNQRIFPVIDSCINNVYKYKGERSPDTARSMRFKLAVRDVHNGYGAFSYDEDSVVVKVIQGPELFRVTSQNTLGLELLGGNKYPITWNVAGSDTGNVNATHVNIYLSTDGGYTYPIVLATNVPNDGLDTVLMPKLNVANARVKVKGHNNIFFDLNDTPFKITIFSTDVTNASLSQVRVYPNPAQQELSIDNISENTNIKLINIMGQVMYSASISKPTNINLSGFAKGLYTILLSTPNGQMQSLKLIHN